jgi:hypothetical protein
LPWVPVVEWVALPDCNHVKRIYDKIAVSTRAGAALFAMAYDLLDSDQETTCSGDSSVHVRLQLRAQAVGGHQLAEALMRVRVNVDINRPIDTVFDYLADPSSCVDWLGVFTESIAVERGGLRVGGSIAADGEVPWVGISKSPPTSLSSNQTGSSRCEWRARRSQ